MWGTIKGNRPLQMWVLTGASDKIAQTTGGQTAVATMLNGILIGSYTATTMISNAGMLVGLAFAVVGGILVSKMGAKKITSLGSWAAVILYGLLIAFCVFLGPDGMKSIGTMGTAMIIYIVFMMLGTGVRMVLTMAQEVMRADVTDYEIERSGNFMLGTVSGVYSFIDKLVSSLASTIAALCISLIGYKNVMPQMGDAATWAVLGMTMFLSFGLPIIGWICNIVAMRFYELDKDRMVEVQKHVAEMRAENSEQ